MTTTHVRWSIWPANHPDIPAQVSVELLRRLYTNADLLALIEELRAIHAGIEDRISPQLDGNIDTGEDWSANQLTGFWP